MSKPKENEKFDPGEQTLFSCRSCDGDLAAPCIPGQCQCECHSKGDWLHRKRDESSIRAQAEAVLGDRDKAARWMEAPNCALGGRTPLEVLREKGGPRRVDEILGRIAHGSYS